MDTCMANVGNETRRGLIPEDLMRFRWLEAIALAPPNRRIALALRPGARVSVFPLIPVSGVASRGLVWPLDQLRLGNNSGRRR